MTGMLMKYSGFAPYHSPATKRPCLPFHFALLSIFMITACGGKSECESAFQHMEECGLKTPSTEYCPSDPEPDEECIYDCMLRATCSELLDPSSAAYVCIQDCLPPIPEMDGNKELSLKSEMS